jgi:hypothetical protein
MISAATESLGSYSNLDVVYLLRDWVIVCLQVCVSTVFDSSAEPFSLQR